MSRSAATIFGLVLVAFSIGFNTWRYPIVWQMVGPALAPAATPSETPKPAPAAGESSRPSAATSAARPAKTPPTEPERTTPSLTMPTQGEPKSAHGAASETAIGAKSATDAPSATAEDRLSALTGQEKPLVPVPKMAAAEKPAGAAEGAAAVRRLPPVDPNSPPPAARFSSELPGGVIPIYPSTGID